MINKIINFLLEQVDKIILAIVGLVCIWILVGYVVLNPNLVEYNSKEVRPADIDNLIGNRASGLEDKLKDDPEEKDPYRPKLNKFKSLLKSSISSIDDSAYFPLPKINNQVEIVERIYRIPKIEQVTETSAELFRTVAYIPTKNVGLENTYAQSETEANDIDFVTVQGKFNVNQLYESFHESFAGDQIQQDWRDPCLAKPVFAAVQLQRQQLGNDGTWGDWEIVPRSKIDDYRIRLDIPEDVSRLPLGIKALLVRLNNIQTRNTILQPWIYDIASADEQWYPPELHKKYVEELKKERQQESRSRRTSERERRGARRGERGPDTALPGRVTNPTIPTRVGATEIGRNPRTDGRITGRRGRETGDESTAKTWRQELASEYEKTLIDSKNNLEDLTELIIWAHDDTVEAGQSYRYRMRVGVINPIAGTNQSYKDDVALRSQITLWGQFSDITEKTDVPDKMYFFPRERRTTSGYVVVQVSKYILGYWYSKDYKINIGDEIGKVEMQKASSALVSRRNPTIATKEPDGPKVIDYRTGAILVDVIYVEDWAGTNSLRARDYHEILYTYGGANINHIPIGDRNWTNKLLAKYEEIKESQRRDKQPLKARSTNRQTAPNITHERPNRPENAMPPRGAIPTDPTKPWIR